MGILHYRGFIVKHYFRKYIIGSCSELGLRGASTKMWAPFKDAVGFPGILQFSLPLSTAPLPCLGQANASSDHTQASPKRCIVPAPNPKVVTMATYLQ